MTAADDASNIAQTEPNYLQTFYSLADALQPLNKDNQVRVLRAVACFFGVEDELGN